MKVMFQNKPQAISSPIDQIKMYTLFYERYLY